MKICFCMEKSKAMAMAMFMIMLVLDKDAKFPYYKTDLILIEYEKFE